jgi:transposase InsO family protein
MSDHVGEFSIRAMGRAFGVARSGYDAWVSQGCTTQQAHADAVLTEQIRAIFEPSGQTYGSPRVYAALKAQGVRCRRRHVARLRRAAGLDATLPRRRAHTTQADRRQPSVANLLARDFTADAPNRKWVVAITGVWTEEGWLYRAGVLDLFSRRLVG